MIEVDYDGITFEQIEMNSARDFICDGDMRIVRMEDGYERRIY